MNASKIPIDKKYNATNMASDSNVRRRKPEATTPHAAAAANGEPRVVEIDTDEEEEIKQQQQQEQKKRAKNPKSRISDEDTSNPWLLDFLRVVTFLFLASSGLSYLISGGETFFWGMTNPPNYMKVDWWKSQLVLVSPPSCDLSLQQAATQTNQPTPPFPRSADRSTSPPPSSPPLTAPTRPSPSTWPSTAPSTT